MKILLLEDDKSTADYITKGLTELGHTVQHCRSGRDALFLVLDGAFDVIVVDRMVPDLDGLAVVKSLRSAKIATPVLFLTAIDGVDDRVAGFEAGGDDYLVKPFAFSEFAARVGALGRRPPHRLSRSDSVSPTSNLT